MTSFSRRTHENTSGSLIWELRTVNHRFLEINLRCPEPFCDQEMRIRECIRRCISRGKVDAYLKWMPNTQVAPDFSLNKPLLQALTQVTKQIACYVPTATIDVNDLLTWPGVLQVVENRSQNLNRDMLSLLEAVLAELLTTRQREGQLLAQFIQHNITQISNEIDKIMSLLPEVIAKANRRIQQRLHEVSAELDQQRLAQEMLIWAQRIDVAEELQRLQAHLQEVHQVLAQGGVVGRRLDFLMQELNREANTLSSKSLDANVTRSAIEIKVLIEQMREQIQNIE